MIDAAQLKRLMAQLDIKHDVGELLPLVQAVWVVAAKEERDECAKVCDGLAVDFAGYKDHKYDMKQLGAEECAEEIRARGGKQSEGG